MSVSAPLEMLVQMEKKGIGSSKCFQLGISIALSGGVEVLDKLNTQIRVLEKSLKEKNDKVAELEKRFINCKEALDKSHKELAKKYEQEEKA